VGKESKRSESERMGGGRGKGKKFDLLSKLEVKHTS
jgi:hypothetical protein